MATINGLKLKSITHFMGMEGDAYQGNLYLNNKKIAFWSQDGDGGIIDRFDFEPGLSESKFRDLIARTIDPWIGYDGQPQPMSAEVFMDRLLDLTETEKEYKKAIKKGFGYCVKAESPVTYPIMYRIPIGWDKERAGREVEKEFREDYPNAGDPELVFYESPQDFIIGEPYDPVDIMK